MPSINEFFKKSFKMKIAKKSSIVLLFTYFEKSGPFYLNQLLDLAKFGDCSVLQKLAMW